MAATAAVLSVILQIEALVATRSLSVLTVWNATASFALLILLALGRCQHIYSWGREQGNEYSPCSSSGHSCLSPSPEQHTYCCKKSFHVRNSERSGLSCTPRFPCTVLQSAYMSQRQRVKQRVLTLLWHLPQLASSICKLKHLLPHCDFSGGQNGWHLPPSHLSFSLHWSMSV